MAPKLGSKQTAARKALYVTQPRCPGCGRHGPAHPHPSVEESFWAKVDKRGPDECWPWLGSRVGRTWPGHLRYGYYSFPRGVLAADKRVTRHAHKAAWILTRGPVPPKQCVLHTCDNPLCVNLAHLFLGTKKDNSQDAMRKGRQRLPWMPRTELSQADLVEMRRLYTVGVLQNELASRFNVSRDYILRIVKGK